jgi:NAD(P)-dependent dehydrogenase (short-subunit alcohol dehydrogenase family)
MTERIRLEGKVAVVTGAGRGLGRAYVELLAESGARVVVNDLGTDVSGLGKDSTIAEQVADLICSRGGEAIANDSDVSTRDGGSALIATAINHFGRVDLLVNNAGICGGQPFEDATLHDFDHYWRVHLGGPVKYRSLPGQASRRDPWVGARGRGQFLHNEVRDRSSGREHRCRHRCHEPERDAHRGPPATRLAGG